MTGDHHGHSIGRVVDPILQQFETLQIKMVGGLVQQQHVRIGDPDAGNERQALPAATEFGEFPLAHGSRGVEQVQYHAGLPCPALPFRHGNGATDRLIHWQFEQVCGSILLHQADAKAAATGYLTRAGIRVPSQAAQQGGLAAAVAGDQSDTVGIVDGEIEVLEKDSRRDYADVSTMEQGHGVSLVLSGRRSDETSCHGGRRRDRAAGDAGQKTRV